MRPCSERVAVQRENRQQLVRARQGGKFIEPTLEKLRAAVPCRRTQARSQRLLGPQQAECLFASPQAVNEGQRHASLAQHAALHNRGRVSARREKRRHLGREGPAWVGKDRGHRAEFLQHQRPVQRELLSVVPSVAGGKKVAGVRAAHQRKLPCPDSCPQALQRSRIEPVQRVEQSPTQAKVELEFGVALQRCNQAVVTQPAGSARALGQGLAEVETHRQAKCHWTWRVGNRNNVGVIRSRPKRRDYTREFRRGSH